MLQGVFMAGYAGSAGRPGSNSCTGELLSENIAAAQTSAVVDAALALTANLLEGALAKVPEDQWFERESAWVAPRDLAAPLVAMANADGGVSVVGMHGGVLELSIRG